ncbi:uncharacterized protein LOC113792205 [Dermatophagoides pteronyssinus]|uniref:uncharacterized protein LOC113792205 n=1 Tax=Dermatophagoides pteronyssinus TaxID=6956 RepID=UPI003F6684CE
MSGRKFFKSNRSQRLEASSSSSSTIRRDVIDDFLLSNDEIEPIELNNKRKSEIIIQQEQEQPHQQQQQNDNDDEDADSSGIDDDFEFDHFGEDDFEPLFIRCSTPNHQELDYHHHHHNNLSQSINNNNNIERPKINPWDKALSENESLKEWVKKFNEHIEMVDNSEVVIKKIKH